MTHDLTGAPCWCGGTHTPQPGGVGMVNTAEAVVLVGIVGAALAGFVLCAVVAFVVYVWRVR